MLKNTLTLIFTLTVILSYFSIYTGCASRGAPSGGPVDKTPPEVIKTFPATDSTNIRELTLLTI